MQTINEGVISALQASLRLHWSAIETYAGQAEHFARLGYSKLAAAAKEDAEEERGHCHKLLSRLEAFDAVPEYFHELPQWPRGDVPGILASNLALETEAAQAERAGFLQATLAADAGSAGIFSDNLEGSEAAIIEIEAKQRQIAAIGLDNWLTDKL